MSAIPNSSDQKIKADEINVIDYTKIENNQDFLSETGLIKQFQYKPNTELYRMNIDDLKRTIFGCAEMDEMMIKSAYDSKKYDTYVVYDDSKSIEYIDLNGKVIGYEKGHYRKKTMKNSSKSKSKTKKSNLKI